MKRDTETLIVIGVLIWLLWPKTGTSVIMTSDGGEIMQTCYALGGFPYQIPVSTGRCPENLPLGGPFATPQ